MTATARNYACSLTSADVELQQALDCEHMQPRLSAAMEAPVTHLTVERVLFSKSRPTIVHYRYAISDDIQPSLLIGELVGDSAPQHFDQEIRRLRKAKRSQLDPHDHASLVLVSEPGMVVRRPGLDTKIEGLRMLHDRALAADLVGQALGVHLDAASLNMTLRAHRLGKRAVLSAEVDGITRCYVRLRPVTNTDGARNFQRHRTIARHLARSAVVVPRALSYCGEWGAAFYTALAGAPPALAGDCAAIDGLLTGQALCEFRTKGPVDAAYWSVDDEIAALQQWSELVNDHLPAISEPFASALDRIARELRHLPVVAPQCCHRDFHESQVLIGDRSCGLIDFDTCCTADPALDVGNFLAHVRLWELRSGVDAGTFSRAFAAGVCGPTESTLIARAKPWTRAALLRLAAIYGFTSEARQTICRLIAEAAS